METRWYHRVTGHMVSQMPGSKAFRATLAASLRTAREAQDFSREFVIFRMMELGHPISVSTLARWEQYGNVKVEDAYYLSQVYGTTPAEMLLQLPFPVNAKERAAAEGALRDAESLADEAPPEPKRETDEGDDPPRRSA